MLEIAICDDMPEQLKRIATATEHYFTTHPGVQAEVRAFQNPLLFLEHLEKHGGVDIALLDICMPGVSGTEVAREIRRRNDKTQIVFLTTSDEFAVVAFSLKVAHYLLKPFTQSEFDEAMGRALEGKSGPPRKLSLRLPGGGVKSVEVDEITFIESFQHEQKVHLEGAEPFVARESLRGVLAQLEGLAPGQFFTPYKGYVVNWAAVRSVEQGGLRFHSGDTVPIARRSFRELSDQYFSYTFGTMASGDAAK